MVEAVVTVVEADKTVVTVVTDQIAVAAVKNMKNQNGNPKLTWGAW